MDSERRARLERIMAAMASDEAAVIELYEEFHDEIAAVVGFRARQRGQAVDDDDLQALVFDACFELGRVARSWRADGGALPWVWARRRVDAVVDAALPLAHRRLPADDDLPPAPPTLSIAGDDPDVGLVLGALAERDPLVALLVEALRESVGLDDGHVWLRYVVQQQAGDPSPANTVAVELGLRPPAVRQKASRARRRLARHLAADDRFASLADLPLVAGAA